MHILWRILKCTNYCAGASMVQDTGQCPEVCQEVQGQGMCHSGGGSAWCWHHLYCVLLHNTHPQQGLGETRCSYQWYSVQTVCSGKRAVKILFWQDFFHIQQSFGKFLCTLLGFSKLRACIWIHIDVTIIFYIKGVKIDFYCRKHTRSSQPSLNHIWQWVKYGCKWILLLQRWGPADQTGRKWSLTWWGHLSSMWTAEKHVCTSLVTSFSLGCAAIYFLVKILCCHIFILTEGTLCHSACYGTFCIIIFCGSRQNSI